MKQSNVYRLRLSGILVCISLVSTLFLASCKQETTSIPTATTPLPTDSLNSPIPKKAPTMNIPADNPMDNSDATIAKIELGRRLFYDKNISVDASTSCASCHNMSHAFSDIFPTSMGFQNQHGTRNAPALANVAYNAFFTWDGRFKSLEAHAPGPIFNSLEMGNNLSKDGKDTVSDGYNSKPGGNDTLFLFKRLSQNSQIYADLFTRAFGDANISMDRIAKSLATFERKIISTQSDFDKFNNGDQNVFKYNPEAIRGFKLFIDPNNANCVSCHSGYNFTDQKFHDNGIGIPNTSGGDRGRFNITKDQSDDGKFKTPSLRNVSLTGPYMHDGRFTSLTEIVNHYNKGGQHTTHQDPNVKPLNLSDQDVADIVEFLKTLQDNSFTQNGALANPWK